MREEIIVVAADHNGIETKTAVKRFLCERGCRCIDFGPNTDQEKVDYPDYARLLARSIDAGEADRGILICGTGVGMSIVANRFPNVRAVLAHSIEIAQKSREHNNANVLCLGAWVNSIESNLQIVETWLNEPFGEGRHIKRVEKTKEHIRPKIVFTNGIFDLLHLGHLQLLKFAKSLAGRDGKLIVAINSDQATRALKGPERPIVSEFERKAILESLGFVDQVIIFNDAKTLPLLETIKPDILVKGGEWTAEEIRQRDQVPDGIEIKIFSLLMQPRNANEKYSTTSIIQGLQRVNGSR